MADTQFEALHQVRVATEDILSGYETLSRSANFEGDPLLADLVATHQKHLGEVRERQSALGYSSDGDSVEVILQDWVDTLASESSDAVELGERALLQIYEDALTGWPEADDPETSALLKQQYEDIQAGLGRLKAGE